MKIFISQPMRGKTDEEIKTERERVINRLMKMFPDENNRSHRFFL